MNDALVSEPFYNLDSSLSHWSVCILDAHGGIEELATCVMHDSREACDAELATLKEQS